MLLKMYFGKLGALSVQINSNLDVADAFRIPEGSHCLQPQIQLPERDLRGVGDAWIPGRQVASLSPFRTAPLWNSEGNNLEPGRHSEGSLCIGFPRQALGGGGHVCRTREDPAGGALAHSRAVDTVHSPPRGPLARGGPGQVLCQSE